MRLQGPTDGIRQRRQRVERTAKRQGLAPHDVEALRRSQNGLCPVCLRPLPATFVVDHDHELARAHGHDPDTGCPGCVRGLVCRRCNSVLGWGYEDPEFFVRAARYLARRRVR